MSCGGGCGGCAGNVNESWSCSNPCATGNSNTAACESLPSALDNFIKHFFGSVIKTETNGQVAWSLPCNLEIGLPNNPRAADEGLACYYLRLFGEGIVGLTGPQGPDGTPGTNGYHAFTVTKETFVHPTVGGFVTVPVFANPVIKPGEVLFIQGSGWYSVVAVSGDYNLVLQLIAEISGATGNIIAGRIVALTGPQGVQGNTGSTGPQGAKGDKGDTGDVYTPIHDFVACAGSNYSIQVAAALVTFAGTEPQLTLPTAGDYMVDVIVGVQMDNTAAVAPGEIIKIQIWNATAAAFEADMEKNVQAFLPNQNGQIVTQGLITTTVPNEQLQLYASISVGNKAVVVPAETTLRYVKLS